jgi:hypothetical protein
MPDGGRGGVGLLAGTGLPRRPDQLTITVYAEFR